ncbi:MAG: hypothetical protein NTY10_06810, partial [Candidatus Omnitrophica bacterium]|nr:hypothetical protein [Candidatus Omnitrophota bacterium]
MLSYFSSGDKVFWFDGDGNGLWSAGDSLWINNDANNTYDFGDNVVAGTPDASDYGVLVHGSAYGFAYYDADASLTYTVNDEIYFLGRGRNVLGYYADVNLSPVAALPVNDSNYRPDFFVSFRTGEGIRYSDDFGGPPDKFSFSLPSNAIIYSSGYSYAANNPTTNTLTSRIPVFLTDLVQAGDLIEKNLQKAVIGINLYSSFPAVINYLSELNVYLSGTNVFGDLAELSATASTSGVSLYRDANNDGIWQVTDIPVDAVSIANMGGGRVRIRFPAASAPVPDTDTGSNAGDDYFVVLQTGDLVTSAHTLQAEILSSFSVVHGTGIIFADAATVSTGNSGEYLTGTNPLTCHLFSLTVDSLRDTPSPVRGTNFYGGGDLVTASVTSPDTNAPTGTQYVCTGWTGTGSVPATGTGTSVAFNITQNSTITWNWQTEYRLAITASAGGAVYPAVGNFWYKSADAVIVTANPDSGFQFSKWTVDGTDVIGSSPFYTATMTAPHTVNATFVAGSTSFYQLNTGVSPSGSGLVSFEPNSSGLAYAYGNYETGSDTSVIVTAQPAAGYAFSFWSGEDVEGSTINPVTITMDKNRALVANMTAAVLSFSANQLTSLNQGILPENGNQGMALFGFDLFSAETAHLKRIHFSIQDAALTDGLALDTTLFNFAVYRDDYVSNEGYFFQNDSSIAVNSIAWNMDPVTPGKFNAVLDVTSPDTLPVDNAGGNSGYDYYLALKTGNLPNNLKFTATLNDAVITRGGVDSPYSVSTTTNIITCEAKVTDLLNADTNYDYSIPEEMLEPAKDYLLRGDQTFLLTQNEYLNYDTGLNLPKFLFKPTVLPLDTPTAVIGISAAGNAGTQVNPATYQLEMVDSITITFKDTSGGRFNPQTKLEPLTYVDLTARGVAVYADGGDGIFQSSSDFPIRIDTTRGVNGYIWGTDGLDTDTLQIFFDPTDARALVENAADTLNDFLVALRLNPESPPYGATFKAYIKPGDIKFKYVPAAGQTALSIAESVMSQGHVVFALSDLAPRYIDATSSPIPIIGLNLAFGTNSSDTFDHIKVTLSGTGLTSGDLAAILGGTQPGGLMLYKDNKSSGRVGTFDINDTPVSIHSMPWVNEGGGKFSGIVEPSTAITRSGNILANDLGSNRGDDYFICLVTSDTIDYLDRINVEVGKQDVQISGYPSVSNGLFLSDGITATTFLDADFETSGIQPIVANVPTFITDLISSGQTIGRNSDPTAVFKVKAFGPETGNPVYLQEMVIQIVPDIGFNLSDLAADTGLALYKDTNGSEVFDSGDTFITPIVPPISLTRSVEGYYRFLIQLQ